MLPGLSLEISIGKTADTAIDREDSLILDKDWSDDSFAFFVADAELERNQIHQACKELDPWQKFIEMHLQAITKEVQYLREKVLDAACAAEDALADAEMAEAEAEGETLTEQITSGILVNHSEANGQGQEDGSSPDFWGEECAVRDPQVRDGGSLRDLNGLGLGAEPKKSRKPGSHKHKTVEPPTVMVKEVAEGVEASENNVELPEEYSFHESIWDVSLFIGTAPMGHFGSIMLIICLLAQFSMSCVFIFATFDPAFLGGYDEDQVIRLRQWRANAGHSHKYMQEDSGVGISLVSRVCMQDTSLEVSADKMFMLGEIQAYERIGSVMSLLAVVVWWLVVLNDMNDCWNFVRGISSIEKRDSTDIVFHQQYMKIKTLSRVRSALAFIIAACRVSMAAALVYAGTKFLLNTLSVGGIILNAISLDVILSLDELLYLALAPAQAKDFMNKLEPLANPPLPRVHGLDLRSGVAYPIIAVGIVGIAFEIGKTIERLEEAEQAICGGIKTFAYERDRGGMMLWMPTVKPVLPTTAEWESTRDFASYGAWQIIDDGYTDQSVQVSSAEPLAWSPGSPSLALFKLALEEDRKLTEETWLYEVYRILYPPSEFQCIDVLSTWHDARGYSCPEYEDREFCTSTGRVGRGWLGGSVEATSHLGFTGAEACCYCGGGLKWDLVDMDGESTFPTRILRWLATVPEQLEPSGGFDGADTCEDLASYCLQIDKGPGMIARALCPATCGCADLAAGAFNFGYGCHPSSQIHYARQVSDKAFLSPCVDAPVETISNWVNFLGGNLKQLLGDDLYAAFQSEGCTAILEASIQQKKELCSSTFDKRKSFLPLCPTSCGCQETPVNVCPRSCTVSDSALIISGFGWSGTEKSRVIEVYVARDVANMSDYSMGVAVNGRDDSLDFTFDGVPAKRGEYIYLGKQYNWAIEDTWPGLVLNYEVQAWIRYNGNDNIILYQNGSVVDRYGVPQTDGTDAPWFYGIDKPYNLVYRKTGTSPNWFFSRTEWAREPQEYFGTFKANEEAE